MWATLRLPRLVADPIGTEKALYDSVVTVLPTPFGIRGCLIPHTYREDTRVRADLSILASVMDRLEELK